MRSFIREVHHIALHEDVGSLRGIVCHVEVFSLGEVPCGRLSASPYNLAGCTYSADGQYEFLLIVDGKGGTMIGHTLNLDVVEGTNYFCHLSNDIFAWLEGLGTILAMFHHLNDGLQVLRAIVHPDFLVEFGLNGQLVGHHLVCFDTVSVEIEHQTRTKAHGVVCRRDITQGVLAAWTDDGSIISLDAAQELTILGVQFSKTVEP